MSTKKIEGYADGILAERPHNSIRSITLSTDKRFEDLSPATLVIHSGEHEPVYTQSEVVAMLREIHEKIEGMAEFADEFYTDAARETTARTVRAARRHLQLVATKHGFTL